MKKWKEAGKNMDCLYALTCACSAMHDRAVFPVHYKTGLSWLFVDFFCKYSWKI